MPKRPKRPCSYPGCSQLAECGDRYCDEHKKQTNHEYNKYRRDPETKKRYGKEWRSIRDLYIRAHPLCEECSKLGLITPAQEVHHILPLAHGGTNEATNLMSLCKACHSRITVQMGDRWNKEK